MNSQGLAAGIKHDGVCRQVSGMERFVTQGSSARARGWSELDRKTWGLDAFRGIPAGTDVKKAPPGFEPGIKVLQTSALPLGYGAALFCMVILPGTTSSEPPQRKRRSNLTSRRIVFKVFEYDRPASPVRSRAPVRSGISDSCATRHSHGLGEAATNVDRISTSCIISGTGQRARPRTRMPSSHGVRF